LSRRPIGIFIGTRACDHQPVAVCEGAVPFTPRAHRFGRQGISECAAQQITVRERDKNNLPPAPNRRPESLLHH
jgi:hypothetical protein